MKNHLKKIAWNGAWVATLITAAVVIAGSIWLWWPYPKATSSNDWTLINPPADGFYRAGDQITWTKPKVCVPPGLTVLKVWATSNTPQGQVEDLLLTRKINTPGYCRTPNTSTVRIPEFLAPGRYQLHLEACTNNPTPLDRCRTYLGPIFTIPAPTESAPNN